MLIKVSIKAENIRVFSVEKFFFMEKKGFFSFSTETFQLYPSTYDETFERIGKKATNMVKGILNINGVVGFVISENSIEVTKVPDYFQWGKIESEICSIIAKIAKKEKKGIRIFDF